MKDDIKKKTKKRRKKIFIRIGIFILLLGGIILTMAITQPQLLQEITEKIIPTNEVVPFSFAQEPKGKSTSIIDNSKWVVTQSEKDWEARIEDPYEKETTICLVNPSAKSINDIAQTKGLYNDKGQKIEDLNRQTTSLSAQANYGYCYDIKAEEYIKFGEHSTIVEYQELRLIMYDWGTGHTNITLNRDDGNIGDIYVSWNVGKYKFGANDTNNSGLEEYTYVINSTNKLVIKKKTERNFYLTNETVENCSDAQDNCSGYINVTKENWFDYDYPIFINVLFNESGEYREVYNFNDICSDNYSNCSWEQIDDYSGKVYFSSDMYIDPEITEPPIIKIYDAEHLYTNRTLYENIFVYVEELGDDLWRDIPANEWVRAYFEANLSNGRAIDFYARNSSSSVAKVEVYKKDDNTLITTVESINEEGWYKAKLSNMSGIEDVFDLKIIDGDIEFDYIVDPVTFINFTMPPTPANGSSTDNTSVQINVSISTSTMNETTWNWNGTNYTLFNDSLALMYNMDNVGALGESSSVVVDVSNGGRNGTITGATVNTTDCMYGNCLTFDGNDRVVTNYAGTNKATYMGWVQPHFNSDDAGVVRDVFRDTGNDLVIRYELRDVLNVNDVWAVYVNWPGTAGQPYNLYSADGQDFDAGDWIHIAVTLDYDTDVYALYLDGVHIMTNDTVSFSRGGQNIFIGDDGAYPWLGNIDEVRWYSRVLSADEVAQSYMSNLNKYDQTEWALYVNQSQNATTGLENGTYTYQAYARDNSGNSNQTDEWEITIGSVAPPSFNVTACGSLTTANEVYTQTANIIDNTLTDDCIIITAENITFDGNGYYISSTQNYSAILSDQLNTTIKNTNLTMGTGDHFNSMGIELTETADYSTISNNTVIGSGTRWGIRLYGTSGADNCLVEDNFVNVSCGGATGCNAFTTLNSNFTTVRNNIFDGSRVGAWFEESEYSVVEDNTIIGDIGVGLKVGETSHYSNITNNIVTANATHGIYFESSDYLNVINNSVTSNAGIGIYLTNADNSTFTNNSGYSGTLEGIHVSGSDYNNLINNSGLGVGQEGFKLTSSDYNNLTGNLGNATNSIGLEVSSGDYNTLIENIGNSASSYGIYIYLSTYTTLTNNNFTSGSGWALYSLSSNYTVLTNDYISSSSNYGIYMRYGTDNTFNMTNTSGTYGIYLRETENNLFVDCIEVSGSSGDVYVHSDLGSDDNTFLNCSYTAESVNGATNDILRQWYYQAYVNDTNGNPVSGAYVTGSNVSGILQFNLSTNGSGWTNRINITDYDNIGGTISYYSNYTLNATDGTNNANHSYNVTLETNKLDDLFTLEADAFPTITDPRNFTHQVNTSFSEVMNATDDVGISYYWLNDTSVFNISQTGVITNVSVLNTLTIYWLNYSVNDTLNQITSLEFFINVTPPLPPAEGNISIIGNNRLLDRVVKMDSPSSNKTSSDGLLQRVVRLLT